MRRTGQTPYRRRPVNSTLGPIEAILAMPAFQLLTRSGDTTPVEMTLVGPGLYRLDEEATAFFALETDEECESCPVYGDTIRAIHLGSQALQYVELHQRGNYVRSILGISKKVSQTPALGSFLRSIEAAGGYWEIQMKGMLYISLPPNSNIDPWLELGKLEDGA